MGLLNRRPPKVEKLKRRGDVAGLARALSYEDPIVDRDGRVADLGVPVRLEAAEALGELEEPGAFEALTRALEDPNEGVRIEAVRGLRKRGDPLAVDQLTSAVTNWGHPGYARARAEALETLAFLRDPTVPRRVVAGLLTRPAELDAPTDAPVLRRVAHAGGHDALEATIGDLIVRLREGSAPERTRTLLVWLAPESVQPMIDALAAVPARREAVLALGETRDSRAVESLCTVLLGDDEAPIRAAAAQALGEIRDLAATEALLLASGDSDYEIRTAAADSFDKLGNAAIAVAMSALVRPALENGDSASAQGIGSGDGDGDGNGDGAAEAEPPEGEAKAAEPTAEQPAPAAQPAAAGQEPQPAWRPQERPSIATQVSPILRRWLGRRPQQP